MIIDIYYNMSQFDRALTHIYDLISKKNLPSASNLEHPGFTESIRQLLFYSLFRGFRAAMTDLGFCEHLDLQFFFPALFEKGLFYMVGQTPPLRGMNLLKCGARKLDHSLVCSQKRGFSETDPGTPSGPPVIHLPWHFPEQKPAIYWGTPI